MSTDPVLRLAALWANYDATPILQGVDMTIHRGEIVGLIGRNGVGKTTTLRCAIGQLRAMSGTVEILGRNMTGHPSDAFARLGVGYIPQGREVFPRMTVAENLAVGELVGGRDGRKLHDLVYQYFPRLKERRKQMAGTMSGGEQQQLAIGRALVGSPALMLLDEPSEGVQPSIVQMICEVLQSIRRDLGTTILFVEQNLDTILSIAERCYVMEKGRITAEIGHDAVTADVVRSHLSI